jgi:2-C-methyl-D-erythritol 4-phosphate cytidylyltransferase
VLPDSYLSVGKKILADEFGGSDRIILTKGGDSRYQSVKNGLSLIAEESVVFVHDGVRCLVTHDLIHRCYEQTLLKGSAVPAIPVTESVRAIDGHLHKPADRNQLRLIQTPQTFLSSILLPAFIQDEQDNFTDEATVVESSGQEVFLVEGEFTNMKITRPHDLDIAQKILGAR